MKFTFIKSLFNFRRKPNPLAGGELFYQMMEHNNEMVVVMNTQLEIIYRSPAAARISGWDNSEILNADMLGKIIHPEDLVKIRNHIREVMDYPDRLVNTVMRARHKNGNDLYLDASISFLDTGKTGAYIILNVRDVTDRILREQRLEEKTNKLAEREEQLQLYVEHNPAAIAMFDTKMKYLVASQKWKQDYRLEGKEITGISHYHLFSDISDEWKAIHQRCLQGAIEKNDEDLYIRADGSKSWLRWEVRPWHTAKGSVGGIIIFAEDITERKRSEEKIAVSEERYRTLVERVSDGFVALDTDWKFTYVNPVAESMLGRTAASLAGKIIWDEFPEAVNGSFYKAYQEAMAEQKNIRLQGFSLTANVWMDVNAYPSPTGLSVYFRDITSEKKAAQQAAASEEKYRELVGRISDAFISVDHNWNLVYANSMAEKMFGYEAAYVAGKNLWELFPNAVDGPFYKNYHEALQTQQHISFTDYSTYAKKWMQVNVHPSPTGLTVYFRDINEQVTAEAAARKSEETRRLIMSAALDAVVCISTEGNIIFWNTQAEQLFGWSWPEVEAKPLHSTIIPGHLRKKHLEGFSRYGKSGNGQVINRLVEITAVDKAGREFPIEIFIVEVKSDTTPFFCAYIRDITERKTKERELIKTNERLRRTQEIAQLGSVEIDFETNRSIWSDEAKRIYGLNNGQAALTPKQWMKVIHPDDFAYVKDMVERTIITKTPISFYHRILRKNGEIRHVLSNGKFEYRDDGRLKSMHGIVHDITELKKLELELLEQQQKEQLKITAAILEAEEKERNAIGEKLHDNVNQILTGVFLQLSRVKSKQLEAAGIVDTSMEYLKKAIEENRKISKELITPGFASTPLVEQLKNLTQYMFSSTGISTHIDAAGFNEQLLTEKQKLIAYRVLQEQCTNITKYANASTVSVELSTTDNLFSMVIADNGAGMEASSTAGGIGIRNIKSRLSLLNGMVYITTSPGNGFILKIVFPVTL